MDKKIAINLNDSKEYRFIIEDDGNYFVFAPKHRTRGWRYNSSQFFNYYKIKETKTNLSENDKWKKRLKKAITLCKQNDLWHNLQEIWKTYIITCLWKRNDVFAKNIGLVTDTTKKKASKII